ncbi:MAG: DnaJ domain-containing protein [Luteolibacter sp.]
MNAFELLKLKPALIIDSDAISQAFCDAAKQHHPDQGGDTERFNEIRAARDLLCSPSRRLKEWLRIHQIEVDPRGTVDATIMDLFSCIGELSQRCEALAKKREATLTRLALAMLENETQLLREELEKTIQMVTDAIARECESFTQIEQEGPSVADQAGRVFRNLSFLEKWLRSMQSARTRML